MFKSIVTVLIVIVCFLSSCNQTREDKDRFVNAYLDILIAREKFNDSTSANKEVMKVYDRYGFTETSFRDKYFEFAENPNEFIQIVDSIRELAKRKVKEIEGINKDKKEIEEELE